MDRCMHMNNGVNDEEYKTQYKMSSQLAHSGYMVKYHVKMPKIKTLEPEWQGDRTGKGKDYVLLAQCQIMPLVFIFLVEQTNINIRLYSLSLFW